MTLDSVSDGYEKLRAKRLGLPDGMKPADDTELPGKRVSRKKKTCKRDKNTKQKLEKDGWREIK